MMNVNTYAAWFVVMWWTWCSSALYSSRYDNGGKKKILERIDSFYLSDISLDVAHHIYKIIELCGLSKLCNPRFYAVINREY
jgi:hypothetical protein